MENVGLRVRLFDQTAIIAGISVQSGVTDGRGAVALGSSDLGAARARLDHGGVALVALR